MVYYVLICSLLTILLLLYMRWRHVKQYWAARGIPYIDPHPFYGSLSFLNRENTNIWMRRIYQEYNTNGKRTPYVGLWYFWKPVLMVNSPELARNVLIRDFANFRNRFIRSSDTDPLGSLNLFTANDPLWSNVRRHLTQFFTSAKLKSMQSTVYGKCKELLDRIESERESRIDLQEMFGDFTTDIIGATAYGIAGDATLTGEGPLRMVTKLLFEPTIWTGVANTSMFFWPEWVTLMRFTFFSKKSMKYMKEVFHSLIQQREREGKSRTRNKDLLDLMLEMKKKRVLEDDRVIYDDVIMAQAAIFLQGGFDTTAIALTFVMYELAFNHQIQEKLHSEILDAIRRSGGDDISSVNLQELTYLQCIIKEILRIHTAMGWLDRVALYDYELDENLKIEAGTPVVVNGIGIQSDPEYYSEPEKFNPDRFLPQNEINIEPYTYLTFGEGPRKCIAYRFAFMTMKIAIAEMVLNYTVEPYPDTKHPSRVEIQKKEFFYRPADTIRVKFIPRHKC